MRRAALIALLLVLGLLAGGCGLGAGESEDGAATITVTRDFGTREVGTGTADPIPGGETVMRMLQRGFEVETRYGGGFVQEINGIAGGRENGRPVDWFYYVNGILADNGATAHKLAAGDDIWWDHHDWSGSADVRAVVGAFPEPFVSGVDGKRLPVRLDCADAAADACDEVAERLGEAGVKAGRSAAGRFGGESLLRIKVGVWADLRKDPAVRRLEEGPKASGVYGRPSAAGDRLGMLDPEGKTVRTLGPGGGLIAATTLGGEAPTWIVTGTDTVGLAAAAAQLRRGRAGRPLRDRGRGWPAGVSLPVLPSPEARA